MTARWREELAAALASDKFGGRYLHTRQATEAADALAPIIERLLTEARAEALREAADELDHRASGGTAFNAAARVVRDRAARIARTATSTEEER